MPNTHEEEPSCSSSPNSRVDTTSSSSSSSLLSKNMMIIQVKTKEGSDVASKEAYCHLTTASSAKQDAFLRYSNDEVRMNALMLSSSSSIKSQASSQQQVERKTRLSWELHPSVLLIEDMLLDAAFNHDNNEVGVDIEDLLRDMQMQIDEDDTQHNNDYLLNTLSPQ
jgi:hypothetical protein